MFRPKLLSEGAHDITIDAWNDLDSVLPRHSITLPDKHPRAPHAALAVPRFSSSACAAVKRRASESGCSVFRNIADEQNDRLLLFSLSDEVGYINLNGQTLKSRPLSASNEKRREHVGDRSWKMYAARGVRVRIDLTVSAVCPTSDEQCEANRSAWRSALLSYEDARKAKELFQKLCGS
jgi:hypothetical protein